MGVSGNAPMDPSAMTNAKAVPNSIFPENLPFLKVNEPVWAYSGVKNFDANPRDAKAGKRPLIRAIQRFIGQMESGREWVIGRLP